MKTLFKVFGMILLGTCLTVTAAFAGEVGVTEKSIKVGVLTALTGPVAGLGKIIGSGSKIAFQAVNDAGGIYGRKFELIFEDNAYNPKQTMAGFKKLVARDNIFGIPLCVGTPPAMAVMPLAQSNKVPTIVYCGPKALFSPLKRYVFVAGMPYQLEIIGLVEYAIKNLDAHSKRIGFLGQDDLKSTTVEAINHVEKAYGIKSLGQEFFNRGAPDVSPQLLALKKAGVDMVFIINSARSTALILKKSMELNYKPTYLGITPSADKSIFKILPPGELEYYAAASTAPILMEIPGIKEMDRLVKKYLPGTPTMPYHLIGYLPARIFIEGVKAAGPDLTREKLIDAFESLKNLDMDGITAPVTFGPKRRFSASSMMIIKMDTTGKTFKIVRELEEVQLNPFK